MILCVPNGNAINGLLPTDIVEITCDINKNGAVPHRMEDIDEQNLELIRRVKIYERLSSEAIRENSIQKAVEALTLHPLVNSYSLAKKLVESYNELNKEYTGGWH